MRIRPSHRRTAVVFLCGLLLFALARQLNHSLGAWGLSVWFGGLLVAFPALRLAPQQGFNTCFLLGLLLDATNPLPFGLLAFLFSVSHLVIVRLRSRLAASEVLIGIVVALITNLILYLIVTFTVLAGSPDAPFSGLRFLTDLIFSQLLLALLAPWFFALQEKALLIARVGLRDEPSATI
ncbi:rod shape-determining protein MreD [Actomonas aquatica]|uniref:Rod shape-determining protein MreD n=1 Tax=Actomonas aquatica TaxID=2866162 RepID=A0ABZ1C6Q0_9BACT|nr:rod shape-determining protein MreD [Opitutus sp. WL0086]WRQ87403.1 rod shape-determining protein MreD [Opitutus sp. WL0086]